MWHFWGFFESKFGFFTWKITEKHFLGWLTFYRLGWVEFYRYQAFQLCFVIMHFLDKNWTFYIVWSIKKEAKKRYQSYFSEIHRNREFYRTNDVRPPFTYASLIRQVSSLWSPIFWLLQKSIIYYVLPRGVLYSLSFFRKQQVKNLIFNEKFPLMFLGRDWISRASADFARDLQLVHLHFCILQKECGKLEGT